VRGCLEGTALRKFNEFALAVGTETSAHLVQVEQHLVTSFAPREVLSQQNRYIRYHMRKPANAITRHYVGAVQDLNNKLQDLPPAFNAEQKISDMDVLDILAAKAPRTHKELMTDQGFDPQTATIQEFVELCERAETKEALTDKRNKKFESDDDSSEDGRAKKKAKKRTTKSSSYKRQQYFCKEHGPNPTHDTVDCKVINGGKKRDKSSGWKKDKKESSGDRYKDYQSKYKKKHQELNLLQRETKKEKAKWMKAY